VQRRPPERQPGVRTPERNLLLDKLKRPQILIPLAVVGGMLAVAFGVQPGGPPATAESALPTRAAQTALPTAIPTATTKPAATAASVTAQAPNAASTTTAEVAGARATPDAATTPQADLSHQVTQCGSIKETSTALSVEQAISGVAVRATRAATYPIDYFSCILMATGGNEAVSLSNAVAKAQSQGMTGVVLVDLWITNAAKDFGQVNLRTATLSAAGQTFTPLATLSGRSEVVVSSGQGRNVTLVVPFKNSVAATAGPMTLTIGGPLAAGKQIAGKYQLFLPTP
jgi:hypothetical protein